MYFQGRAVAMANPKQTAKTAPAAKAAKPIGKAAAKKAACKPDAGDPRSASAETGPLPEVGSAAEALAKDTYIAALGATASLNRAADAASAGNLIIHGDFAGVVLALGDKIEFTISLEQA
jgi:hypothetical protein